MSGNKIHTPAAERKIGVAAWKSYIIGFIILGIWFGVIGIPSFFFEGDIPEIELHRILFLGYFLIVGMYVFIELFSSFNKYMPTPNLHKGSSGVINEILKIAVLYLFFSIPFSIFLYISSFDKNDTGLVVETIATTVCFVVLPIILIFVPVYKMILWELIKETHIYERFTKTFSGGEIARWGGVKSYFDFDISNDFRRNVEFGITRTPDSPLFIGRTIPEYDFKILGRDIGTVSEQHLITIAGTGAGKSRDAINSNLLTYCGGLIVLDIKGEHARLAYERRKKYAPCYIVDPFNITGDNKPKSYWNPLDEIDPESTSARGSLKRIAQAVVMKEKNEKEQIHFREIPQLILRGYLAHVLTAYPREQRHLGTVYDLFTIGNSDGEDFDPRKVEKVIEDMAKNNAIGGAPVSAAVKIMAMSPNERSGHYTSLARALDWINDENIRAIICRDSNFSVKECKTKDATVFFAIREDRLEEMNRFIRLFYTLCIDQLNENVTPQLIDSKRRVLMIFDEFESLGDFEPARQAALRARGSNIKCWFVLQNSGQLDKIYSNPQDFWDNCDMQIFGIPKMNADFKSKLSENLGRYDTPNGDSVPLMSISAINSFLDAKSKGQLFMPLHGLPMRLNRVHFDKIFEKDSKGMYS